MFFELDELGYKYYIILKGSVFVLVPSSHDSHKKFPASKRVDDNSNTSSPLVDSSSRKNSKVVLKRLTESSPSN